MSNGIGRFAVILALVTVPLTTFAQPEASELLRRAENSVFPDSFRAEIRLTTREGDTVSSEMELSLLYRHETGSYMEILSPSRSRGLRFLQVDETLWMYNPRAGGGRALRLSPRSAFQGSAFSNRDLSDPEFADDYTVEIAGTEAVDHVDLGSVECWVLDAEATNDQLAYARIRAWVSREEGILVRTHYFAKSGLLFKTAEFTNVREIAGARRPTTIEMTNQQQSDLVSTMSITHLEIAEDLPDRTFTRRYLTR